MTWFCLLVCKQAAVSSAVTVSITLGITLQRRSIAPLRAGFSVCSVPPAGHDYRGLKTHQFLSVNMEAGAAPSPAPRSCPPQTRALPCPALPRTLLTEPSRAEPGCAGACGPGDPNNATGAAASLEGRSRRAPGLCPDPTAHPAAEGRDRRPQDAAEAGW